MLTTPEKSNRGAILSSTQASEHAPLTQAPAFSHPDSDSFSFCFKPDSIKNLKISLQTGVEGADHSVQVLLHHVRVDFGGLDVGVAHELLDHADVDAVFQKVGGKGGK